ncbi:NfeD family protein [Anaerolentibacter hominis]|uniref:NfeD family protein n=1 Tax=Anaerolentibacter hominis TaxID=3079009 RepID=UPI0031B7F94A
MAAWWDSLDMLLRVLYCIAIPATLLLIIQTVLILFGLGDGGEGVETSDTSGLDLDTDVDLDADFDVDADPDAFSSEGSNPGDFATLKLFTFQGFVALFSVFGWTSIAMVKNGINTGMSLISGLVLGFLFMYIIAKLFQVFSRLTSNGTVNTKNALGLSGTVYLRIPGKGGGHGKVNLNIQGQFMEFDAITESSEPIPTGEAIRVTDIRGDCLVVERDI